MPTARWLRWSKYLTKQLSEIASKITNTLKYKRQNLSKETENVKKGQMENLELKNTNNKRKSSVDELNSRLDGDTEVKSMKWKINKRNYQVQTTEEKSIIQKRRKRIVRRILGTSGTIGKDVMFVSSDSQKERRKKWG